MSSSRGGKHMASSKGRNQRDGSSPGGSRRRREPLRDNYTYEEPRAGSYEFEDVSSYSSSRKKKEDQRELERQRQKKKGGTAKKVVIICLVALLALVCAAVYYVRGYLLKDLTFKPITNDRIELGINSEVQMDDSIKNIALLGLDSRNSETEEMRSDVIMIITVDNKHGKIKMTSVLRDSNVSIKKKDDNGDYYYFDDKITHAYYYGGPELVINTLNRNFSLNIEDYVTVNFEQTAEIVDACGGVDIQLTGEEIQNLNQNLWNLSQEVEEQKELDKERGVYEENTYPSIAKEDFFPNIYGERNLYSQDYEYEDGTYHLNGNQAVAYARIRYVGNDDARVGRQQTVLKALIEQARGKSKLEYPEMIRKIVPMCETTLSFEDIVGMVPIMLTDFTVETLSIPGEAENPGGGNNSQGAWVYLYDLEEAAKHINQFIYESDFAPEKIRLDEYVLQVSEIALSGVYSSTGSNENGEGEWSAAGSSSSAVSSEVGSEVSSEVSSEPSSEPSSDLGSDASSWADSSVPSSEVSSDSGSDPSSWVESGGSEEALSSDSGGEDGSGYGGGEEYTPQEEAGWEEGAANGNVTE